MYFTIRLQDRYGCILHETIIHATSLMTINDFVSGFMAPRLPPSKLVLISDMIESDFFSISEMAEQAECSKQIIINRNKLANLEAFTRREPA